ncbi:MAG: hypothetical protein A3K67_00375 [Euryarchaeota archaeon RBG_16_62_10]|nr:MAG: hypothetical protein A3K67_00375 [Euryarchaeota archaeon RBG_16_62_10]
MVYPRDVLNRLRWTEGESLDEAVVWYVHRGAPGDLARIRGSEIKELGRGFFEITDASIPYHRVRRIEYRGKVIFERGRQG